MTATSIEWTDRSSNPLRAYHLETGKRGWFCVHASPGCENCYAERMNRWVGNRLYYRAQDERLVRFEMDGDELHSWAKLAPGTKVFVFDMTDLFQAGLPDELIALAYAAMASAPHLTFQVLTKRADRAQVLLSSERFRLMVSQWWKGNLGRRVEDAPLQPFATWPLPNVWQGASVENQRFADERIPLLLQTPAAKRLVSYEPGLGPVDFTGWLHRCDGDCSTPEATHGEPILDWIIVGGESGPGARPFDIAWARSTVEQCKAAGVAVFVKQLGANITWGCDVTAGNYERTKFPRTERDLTKREDGSYRVHLESSKGGDPSEWPADLRVREFPR